MTDPARALEGAQADRLAELLQRHPEEHVRVLDQVGALEIQDFPWSQVNEGLARDLAICFCFPPSQDTSGMVAAKRLRSRGLVTDVISQDLRGLRRTDPGAVRLVAPVLAQHHVVPGPTSMAGWEAVRRFTEEAWATFLGWEEVQGTYRSVYSRAVAVHSHFAAALIKTRRPGITWSAEFSDPMKVGVTGAERSGAVLDDRLSEEIAGQVARAGFDPAHGDALFDWAERIVYALADEVVFTNQHQMDFMLGYCAAEALATRARAIATVAHHPTPPAEAYELASSDLDIDPDVVNLAYFGAFYVTRDMGDLVAALQRLRQRDRDELRLHVFTDQPDRLAVEVAGAGLAGVVHARAYVPVLEFLSLTRQFECSWSTTTRRLLTTR